MTTINAFPLETTPLATALQALTYSLYKATSTTSLAIGTGTKVFTTQAGKDFAVGDFVMAASNADTTNYMIGRVVTYTGTALTLTVPTAVYTGGSGTFADWTLRVSGPPGGTGATGATGPGYAATSVSSQVIGSSGTKTFTTQTGLAYAAGTRVRAADASAPSTNWMEGVASSYSGSTLVFTADKSAGSGTLTNWTLNAAGEPGAAGAGSGDFSTTAALSVDGEMLLYSGTGGKTGKRSTLNGGLLKSTSGVPAIAVAGTDYLAPAAIGVTVQGFDADLSTLAALGNWKLAYTNGSGAQTALALGAAGLPLVSGGAAVAPSFAALTLAGGGLGITSGVSGGIPYFINATTMATSAVLTANAPLIGGGAGQPPGLVAPGTTGLVYTGVTGGAPTFQTAGQTLLAVLTASASANLENNTAFNATYDDYLIVIDNLVPATDNVEIQMLVESGGTFQTTGYKNNVAATAYITVSSNTTVSNTAGIGLCSQMYMRNINSTSVNKFIFGRTAYALTSTNTPTPVNTIGYWNGGQGAITGVRFLASSGNLATGSIKIYGLRPAL